MSTQQVTKYKITYDLGFDPFGQRGNYVSTVFKGTLSDARDYAQVYKRKHKILARSIVVGSL